MLINKQLNHVQGFKTKYLFHLLHSYYFNLSIVMIHEYPFVQQTKFLKNFNILLFTSQW